MDKLNWRRDLAAWSRSETAAGPEWAFAGSLGILYEIKPGSWAGRRGWIPRVVGELVSKGILPSGKEIYEPIVYPTPEAALAAVVEHNNAVQHKASARGRYFPRNKPSRLTERVKVRSGRVQDRAILKLSGDADPRRPDHESALRALLRKQAEERRAKRGRY